MGDTNHIAYHCYITWMAISRVSWGLSACQPMLHREDLRKHVYTCVCVCVRTRTCMCAYACMCRHGLSMQFYLSCLAHSVDQAGLELRDPPASASQVLELKACATTAQLILSSLETSPIRNVHWLSMIPRPSPTHCLLQQCPRVLHMTSYSVLTTPVSLRASRFSS